MRILLSCTWLSLVLACSGTTPVPQPEDGVSEPASASLDVNQGVSDVDEPPEVSEPETMEAETSAPGVRQIPAPARQGAAPRIVAVGDLHGDILSARMALQLAGVMDADEHWIGGETVVVQVGDQLDRGDDERAIMHMLESLADEAHAVGGAIHEADVHVRADNAAERGTPLPEGWRVALSASDLGSRASEAGRDLEVGGGVSELECRLAGVPKACIAGSKSESELCQQARTN